MNGGLAWWVHVHFTWNDSWKEIGEMTPFFCLWNEEWKDFVKYYSEVWRRLLWCNVVLYFTEHYFISLNIIGFSDIKIFISLNITIGNILSIILLCMRVMCFECYWVEFLIILLCKPRCYGYKSLQVFRFRYRGYKGTRYNMSIVLHMLFMQHRPNIWIMWGGKNKTRY